MRRPPIGPQQVRVPMNPSGRENREVSKNLKNIDKKSNGNITSCYYTEDNNNININLDGYKSFLEVISYIYPNDCIKVSKCLLKTYGAISSILSADSAEIQKSCPCSKDLIPFLKSIYNMLLYSLKEKFSEGIYVNSLSDVINHMCLRIGWRSVENLYAILLDKKNRIIREEFIKQGSVSYIDVTVREVARRALLWNASAIVLIHNHPSGDPMPSKKDIDFTNDLESTLRKLDIILHDHLIFSKNKVYSIKFNILIDASEINTIAMSNI